MTNRKNNMELMCDFAKTMLDSVVCSGLYPKQTSDMFGLIFSLNCWLSDVQK